MRRSIALAVLAALTLPAVAQDEHIFTLYRNSVLDSTMRLHMATFDSEDGVDVNRENCAVAADLFQRQDGVSTRFWCEPGRFQR